MEILKRWLHLDRPVKPTKVILTGSSLPSSRHKRNSKATTPEDLQKWITRQPTAPLPTCKPSSWSEGQSYLKCRKNEEIYCLHCLCHDCGKWATGRSRDGMTYCRRCTRKFDDQPLVEQERAGSEGSCRKVEGEMPNLLCGPKARRERQVLIRARRGIDPKIEEGAISLASAKATPASPRETESLRGRAKNEVAEWKEPKFRKNCENPGGGDIEIERLEYGSMIRTCSDDSAVLVSLTDEHHHFRAVKKEEEEVVFNAAQIGSPTGLASGRGPSANQQAKSLDCKDDMVQPLLFKTVHIGTQSPFGKTWQQPPRKTPSKTIKPRMVVEDCAAKVPELPRIFATRGRDLPDLLREAIDMSIPPSKIGFAAEVSDNTLEKNNVSGIRTSNPISIPKGRPAHDDEISDHGLSALAHQQTYHEALSSESLMDLLNHPCVSSSRSSSSPPASQLTDHLRASLDADFFCVPKSLEDSKYCDDLIQSLISKECRENSNYIRDLRPPILTALTRGQENNVTTL